MPIDETDWCTTCRLELYVQAKRRYTGNYFHAIHTGRYGKASLAIGHSIVFGRSLETGKWTGNTIKIVSQ